MNGYEMFGRGVVIVFGTIIQALIWLAMLADVAKIERLQRWFKS